MVVALAACGSDERDAEGLVAEPVAEVAPERVIPPGPPPIYDAEGNLLASDERVSGIVLPVTLEPLVVEERRHVYRTEVPITKVLSYFGPRLMTGRVDPGPGGGATYVGALPRDSPGSTLHVDVAIAPIPGPATRIEIVEPMPAILTPPTEAEAMQDLARHLEGSE